MHRGTTEVDGDISITRSLYDWDKDWHLTFDLLVIDRSKTELRFIHSGRFSGKKTRLGQPQTRIRKIVDEGWEKGIESRLVEHGEK